MGAPEAEPAPQEGRASAVEAGSRFGKLSALLESGTPPIGLVPGYLGVAAFPNDPILTPLRNRIPRRARPDTTRYWTPNVRLEPVYGGNAYSVAPVTLHDFDGRQVRAYPSQLTFTSRLGEDGLQVSGRAVTADGEEVEFVHSAVRSMLARELDRAARSMWEHPYGRPLPADAWEGLQNIIVAGGTVNREPRIQVAETPAIYDPSRPDHCRSYIRKLHRDGHSLEMIARWCPALTWGEIVDALS